MDTTAQIAKDVKKRIKQVAIIEMWGQPLWAPGNIWYDVEDVKADSTGLHLQLAELRGQRPVLEIVAPRNAKVTSDRLIVGEVSSVRFSGKEYKPPAGAKPPALVVR